MGHTRRSRGLKGIRLKERRSNQDAYVEATPDSQHRSVVQRGQVTPQNSNKLQGEVQERGGGIMSGIKSHVNQFKQK